MKRRRAEDHPPPGVFCFPDTLPSIGIDGKGSGWSAILFAADRSGKAETREAARP